MKLTLDYDRQDMFTLSILNSDIYVWILMSVGQTAGPDLFVNIQCTVADATGYVINVLILGGRLGKTKVKAA